METQENSVVFSLFLSPRFGKTLYRMLFNRASRSIAKTGLFSMFFRVFFSRWFLEGVLECSFVAFVVLGVPGQVTFGVFL